LKGRKAIAAGASEDGSTGENGKWQRNAEGELSQSGARAERKHGLIFIVFWNGTENAAYGCEDAIALPDFAQGWTKTISSGESRSR